MARPRKKKEVDIVAAAADVASEKIEIMSGLIVASQSSPSHTAISNPATDSLLLHDRVVQEATEYARRKANAEIDEGIRAGQEKLRAANTAAEATWVLLVKLADERMQSKHSLRMGVLVEAIANCATTALLSAANFQITSETTKDNDIEANVTAKITGEIRDGSGRPLLERGWGNNGINTVEIPLPTVPLRDLLAGTSLLARYIDETAECHRLRTALTRWNAAKNTVESSIALRRAVHARSFLSKIDGGDELVADIDRQQAEFMEALPEI